MKKLVVFLLTVLLVAPVPAITKEDIEPSSIVKIPTIKYTVYEFTTIAEPKKRCVVLFNGGTNKSPITKCWNLIEDKQ